MRIKILCPLLLAAMVLMLVAMATAVSFSTEDKAWMQSSGLNAQIIESDFSMLQTASSSYDLVKLRKACVYLKDDAATALFESQGYSVSDPLDLVKDYYEDGLQEIYASMFDMIKAIDESDAGLMNTAIMELQAGNRDIELAIKEMSKLID
jgi:hypothetical protein